MTNKPWYEDIQKVEIPKFISVIKDLVEHKFKLIDKRNEMAERLKNGVKFLNDPSISPEIFAEASKQFAELTNALMSVEDSVTQIDTDIATILEGKLSDIGFIIKGKKGENENKEIVEGKDIYVLPWKAMLDEEKEIMTPEDIWFFSRTKRLFNANPNNIEFINKDHMRKFE